VLYELPQLPVEAGALLLALVKCHEHFHDGVVLLPCLEENVPKAEMHRNATNDTNAKSGRQPNMGKN